MIKIRAASSGFTLVELSIGLVIIGLLIGGTLAGLHLIRAAAARAQVTQIERFNTAVNTFKNRYNALPGDMNQANASQFGFTARGNGAGMGDGNGIIEGTVVFVECGYCQTAGETVMFWEDLTSANGLNVNMIEGNFSTASIFNAPTSPITGSGIDAYLPQAKIGNGNYVYVWSGGPNIGWYFSQVNGDGQNYYGLSAISALANGGFTQLTSTPGLSVSQASAIDTKIDDGRPQTGNVTAIYLSTASSPIWAAGGGNTGAPPGAMASPSSTTCYDNGGNASNAMQYSLTQNGGSNINCALSFRFQ